MDHTLGSVITRHSKSKHSDSFLHYRKYAVHDNNTTNYHRRDSTRDRGISFLILQWYKRYDNWCRRYWSRRHSLHTNNQRNGLGSTDNNQRGRNYRNDNYRSGNRHRFNYFILLYLLSIGTPVLAEGEDTNVSNPVAAATGNVTNQAVQFQNNGAQSRQYYGPNISCNGSTMTFQPFYMGNHTKPLDEFMQPSSYTLAENWGFQINFMVPLDKTGYKQCKELAKRQEEKMKLEYEITRAHKCADLMKKGFMYRPGTPMAKVCQDIVPIVKVKPPKKFKLF